jgi:hypothetical protein
MVILQPHGRTRAAPTPPVKVQAHNLGRPHEKSSLYAVSLCSDPLASQFARDTNISLNSPDSGERIARFAATIAQHP